MTAVCVPSRLSRPRRRDFRGGLIGTPRRESAVPDSRFEPCAGHDEGPAKALSPCRDWQLDRVPIHAVVFAPRPVGHCCCPLPTQRRGGRKQLKRRRLDDGALQGCPDARGVVDWGGRLGGPAFAGPPRCIHLRGLRSRGRRKFQAGRYQAIIASRNATLRPALPRSLPRVMTSSSAGSPCSRIICAP